LLLRKTFETELTTVLIPGAGPPPHKMAIDFFIIN